MRLLDSLHGKVTDRPPVWFMRQAGRYLPEYKALRATCHGFLDLCYTPAKASEVTLQPITRFGFDAAILFSDILVIPHALGADVTFVEGEGPRIAPIRSADGLSALTMDRFDAHVAPVYETVMQVHARLPDDTALIGFCGAPWTVACYMVEGKGSKEFGFARQAAARREPWFMAMIDLLVEASVDYLLGQIATGAHVVQIFDSWAGLLPPDDFQEFVITPTRRIIDRLRVEAPEIPIIGFPKGAGIKLPEYVAQTGVNGVGIDYTVAPEWAAEHIPSHIAVQGNLDPYLLAADKDRALHATQHILDTWKGRPFIFNLGHGILPHTPIDHVEAVVSRVQGQ